MTNLLVDRCTYTVRISFIIERCRDASHARRHIVDDLIDLRGTHARVNILLYVVKYRNIDLGTLLDSCNLIRILDQIPRRYPMSFLRKTRDLVIKSSMTHLVLLATSTPTRIISSNFN